jgi:hypothetical protein
MPGAGDDDGAFEAPGHGHYAAVSGDQPGRLSPPPADAAEVDE